MRDQVREWMPTGRARAAMSKRLAAAAAWALPAVLALAASSVLLSVLAVRAAIASRHAPRPVT